MGDNEKVVKRLLNVEVKYVKIRFRKIPVEPFIVECNKEFVMKGEHFDDCETIEEIRDKFYDETQDENIEWIEVYTYNNKQDLDNDKSYESLCE